MLQFVDPNEIFGDEVGIPLSHLARLADAFDYST
jgi:hypothetical protein